MRLENDYKDIESLILVTEIESLLHEMRVNLRTELCILLDDIKKNFFYFYRKYKDELEDTECGVLDRHKLSSCLSGAIVLTQPFITPDRQEGRDVAAQYPNELLAFWCGVQLMKMFMLAEYADKPIEHNYILKNFPQLPQTIKDTHGYLACVVCAMMDLRTQSSTNPYDFLGNSDRFFHLERYFLDLMKLWISASKGESSLTLYNTKA